MTFKQLIEKKRQIDKDIREKEASTEMYKRAKRSLEDLLEQYYSRFEKNLNDLFPTPIPEIVKEAYDDFLAAYDDAIG